ncbi:unnamed protein product [Meloidogyne enterolobii]|uniref:Uncharacterized protein n=1 Tax=Meloidogyne enterolobii TaxID=390850 RepID=A0ACB0ZIQ8_MELEN
MRNYFDDKLLLFFTLIVMLMSFSINAEFQSLLIFTTRNEKEKGEENSPLLDDLEWHKMNSFQSSINDFGHTFWKIFLLRGESEPLFVDIQSAIQYDDRTKVIVGNSQSPNGIIDRIFLSPFCWRKGETEEQLAFVMCNRKLDFPLDERGWQINEKIEVGNVGRRSDALMKKEKGGSVWIDLFTFSGVPMVSASTITSKNNEKKIIEKEEEEENEIINEQKRKKSKRRTNKLDDDEEEIRKGSVHEDENEEQEKVNSKKRQRRRRKYDREVKEENEENIEEGNEEENYEKVEGGKQDNGVEEGKNNDEEKSNEEEIEEEVDKEEKENDGEEVDEENGEEGDEGKDEGDEEDKDETEDEEDNEGNVGEDRKENEDDEDDNNDDDNDEFDSTLSIADKKRMCRYRLSCYADKGIKIPGKYGGKEQKQENGEYIPFGKRTLGGTKLKIVDVEKKATLKDAAKQAVKKVRQQEAEGEVLREKYVYDGERVLADFWAELERKNRCKYRRSCYLSGKLPEIKQSEILQWLGSFGSSGFWKGEREEENEEEERGEDEEVKFENMSEYEKKLFCRYRNSCYKNGIKPKINNNSITTFGIKEWNFNNLIEDLKGWLWGGMEGKQKIDKEEPKQTKLECKYRKSCYSSGKLPEELRIDKNEEKQTITKILEGKKVPTSVKELKLFCKYRKSCYVANAAIQQTEIIEKEGNKQNKNITVEENKLIINKSMKNSSPPKEEKKNKKLPKNSSKRKIKIEEKEEENKKEKIKKDCFVDKKRIKETIPPQEGCKFIERRKEEEYNEGGNLEEDNEEVKKRKMKKYIVNEEINEIKEEEREVEEEGEVEEEKKVEEEVEEEVKKEEEEEEKETKNKIRKNKKYNIETKENLVEEKKQWKRRKSLNEDKPLFDWRILSNLLLTGSKEPREFEIEEWEKMSEKERLFRCRQVLEIN